MFPLRLLSYNIHKGFSFANREFVLGRIREAIRAVGAEIVLLQEVGAYPADQQSEGTTWASQLEYLGDEVWPHHAYGKNSVYVGGHHGNAILSKYPILEWRNLDLTTNRFEKRGMLLAVIDVLGRPLHTCTTHLNLVGQSRRRQLRKLASHLSQTLPSHAPLILGGDFNDWTGHASKILHGELGLTEVFEHTTGQCARSFPSLYPILKLDRIYCRELNIHNSSILDHGPWRDLSDHVPLFSELSFQKAIEGSFNDPRPPHSHRR